MTPVFLGARRLTVVTVIWHPRHRRSTTNTDHMALQDLYSNAIPGLSHTTCSLEGPTHPIRRPVLDGQAATPQLARAPPSLLCANKFANRRRLPVLVQDTALSLKPLPTQLQPPGGLGKLPKEVRDDPLSRIRRCGRVSAEYGALSQCLDGWDVSQCLDG